jgi:hypothetical protein
MPIKAERRTRLSEQHLLDQGIGRVVVTFNALRIPNTSVNRYSIPAWIATLKITLSRLRPRTRYHSGRLAPLLDPCTPPVRVGNADAPCLLIPTARLGMIVSKRRKINDGTRKKTRRIPRVPNTSTLRGECERTRVLHV